jgi:hypothetical protein
VNVRSSTAVTAPNCFVRPVISIGMPLAMRSPPAGAGVACLVAPPRDPTAGAAWGHPS